VCLILSASVMEVVAAALQGRTTKSIFQLILRVDV
jgi:hypothetical protein